MENRNMKKERRRQAKHDESVNEAFLHLLELIPPLPVTTDKNHSAC